MRLPYALILVCVAACGDNHHMQGPMDAQDANMPDTPRGDAFNTMSRVWAVGNYNDGAKRQAGSFVDSAAMFPYGNGGTLPPIVVPGGTAVLPLAAAYTPNVFDASADGNKTAFVADITTPGRYDLYVANATGGSPTLLVMGGTLNVEIASVQLSPDGSKVAFTMDSTTNDGGYDMYWVATSGGTPIRVSPDRPLTAVTPSALDVLPTVAWSLDGRYFAFIGDLTEDTYQQAYVVNTTTTNPATEIVARNDIPGSSLIPGVQVIGFDSADMVYFTARLVSVTSQLQLYRSYPDGTERTDLTSLVPTRTDNSAPDIAAFGISPDGTKLAVTADTPTANHYEFFMGAVGATTLPKVSNFTVDFAPNGGQQLAVSYDNQKVATIGRDSTSTRVNAYAASNGMSHRVINVSATCSGCATPDVKQLVWTRDSAQLYLRGDITTNNITKLYRISASATDATPTLAVDSPGAGDVQNMIVVPAGN